MIITNDDKEEIEKVKNLMKIELDMKYLGEIMFFLGIEMIQT